jgi:hypothetical protein
MPEYSDVVDNLGRIYLFLLFISGAVWAFIAVNSFDHPDLFKIALIYALLLIFGFFGISYDRRSNNLGLDSRIWEGKKLKYQLAVGVVFFIGWYLLYMRSGFSVATAQNVGQTALFSVNPTLNFLLLTVLGPLAENIFFFGVLNITIVTFLREIIIDRNKSILLAGIIGLTYFLFTNVPNAMYMVMGASLLTVLTGISGNKTLQKHAPFVITALLVGGLIFPRFHSYAYQLNEKHFIAATFFGIFMCLIVSYIGLLPVDIIHIANNIVAIGG